MNHFKWKTFVFQPYLSFVIFIFRKRCLNELFSDPSNGNQFTIAYNRRCDERRFPQTLFNCRAMGDEAYAMAVTPGGGITPQAVPWKIVLWTHIVITLWEIEGNGPGNVSSLDHFGVSATRFEKLS